MGFMDFVEFMDFVSFVSFVGFVGFAEGIFVGFFTGIFVGRFFGRFFGSLVGTLCYYRLIIAPVQVLNATCARAPDRTPDRAPDRAPSPTRSFHLTKMGFLNVLVLSVCAHQRIGYAGSKNKIYT